MANYRRYGSRLCIGSRCIPSSGLDCRLAAPRAGCMVGSDCARNLRQKFDEVSPEEQAVLKTRLADEYRNQSRVKEDGSVVVSETRVKAIESILPYYHGVYSDDPKFQTTREHFAKKTHCQAKRVRNCSTSSSGLLGLLRPTVLTRTLPTNNWPHEPLINNVPTTETTCGLSPAWYCC